MISIRGGWIAPAAAVLFLGGLSLARAGSIQSLSIDLSSLHPGSVLSGSVVLQNPLGLGDSVQIPLSFTDPANYTPTSLFTTLSVEAGTPTDQFRFSPITFTNLANNKAYTLTVHGAATCAVDFPCQATGRYEANSPAAFSGSYTVTAEAIPEPGYSPLALGMIGTFAFVYRVRRRL